MLSRLKWIFPNKAQWRTFWSLIKLRLLASWEYFYVFQLRVLGTGKGDGIKLPSLLRKNNPLLWFFILPLLLFTFYITFWASEQYQSTATLVLRQNGAEKLPVVNLGLLGGTGAGEESQNAYLLQTFVQSRDMFQHLNQAIGLKKYYQSHDIDRFSRLSSHADESKTLEYYHNMVNVKFDTMSTAVTISATAFSADYAQKIVSTILKRSEQFVNKVSHTLASQQLEFARKQLTIAEKKFAEAEQSLMNFQNKYKLLDPDSSAANQTSVMSSLEQDLVKAKTKLIGLQAYLQPGASQVVTLQQEIAAIKAQMKQQNQQIIGKDKPSSTKKLNAILAKYAWIKLQAAFAKSEYQAAQTALEMAKVNFAKEQNAMIVIEKPNYPDDYSYPSKIYDIITLFFILCIFYMVGKMIVIIIQEHRD